MNLINISLSWIFLALFLNIVSTNVACFTYCTPICCNIGVIQFVKQMGLTLDVTGCAAGNIFPPACYGENTFVPIIRENKKTLENIKDVKRNDIVLTYNINKKNLNIQKLLIIK